MRIADILIQLTEWTEIDDFVELVDAHFREPRTAQEIADYRLGKGRSTFKKFRDEIVPAYHFVVATGVSGSIKFALSDSMPDCWIRHEGQPTTRGIEITRANVKEQIWLARELNECGHGRGFLGLSDDDTDALYDAKIREEPRGYLTHHALEARVAGVLRCIERKKAHSEKQGNTEIELLIEGFINDQQLPLSYWDSILPRLREAAAYSGFNRIHLIGCSSAEFYRCLK